MEQVTESEWTARPDHGALCPNAICHRRCRTPQSAAEETPGPSVSIFRPFTQSLFFSLNWLKSFNLSTGNWKREVMLLSAPRLSRSGCCVSEAGLATALYLFLLSCRFSTYILWWVDFTIPTNKTLIVLSSGKSLEILVWIWKGYAFQTATVGSSKRLWKRAVVAGKKYQKTSFFFYCVLKCKLMMFVWPLTRCL